MVRSLRQRVLDILAKRKLLTDKQLEQALRAQKEKGGQLGRILVDLKFVDETTLIGVLSEELNIPPINLSHLTVDPGVIAMIPKHVAKHYGLIPISKIGNTLTVAMSDPLNVLAMDDLKVMTGCDIQPVIGSEGTIQEAYQRYYEAEGSQVIAELMEDVQKGKLEVLSGESSFANTSAMDVLQVADEGVVVKLTHMILAEGIRLKSSDILIEPFERSVNVRYRVDGILREGQNPPRHIHPALIGRIKILSRLDIAEHRLPQDGRFRIKLRDREIDFRVSIIPSYFGEKACLRIMDRSASAYSIEELGFEQEPLEALKQAAQRPHGMILVCGPTGAGKSSTLYSVLKMIDSVDKNLVTVEDPVEQQFDGINQVAVREEIGLTFARVLRSILRQDPDVIMIGEIRDSETVDIAIKAALTGHLVLSTLHTNDATATVVRLANMGVEPYMISSSLVLVLAQRLIRRLCQGCRKPFEPDPRLVESLNLEPLLAASGKRPKFYQPQGCGECGNTGYRGRVGLGEAFVVTPEVRALIMRGVPESDLRLYARRAGMGTLRENGLAKVMRGITSLEEIMRLTQEEAPLNGQVA
ncbi:MAG: Flp pilus assembly complex ATPase component TadA [Candidatus Omnitrophica bacterium]|nr:Flp pilus assembly complex ATPase component TadA [Candidatus Omnitrophota bacterium]